MPRPDLAVVPNAPSNRRSDADHPLDERARIDRIRRRYQLGDANLSVQRARHYTDFLRSAEAADQPEGVRVALAMREVYRKMDHYIDPDDRIAGTWTEFFLGCPIDIERGVFNSVLENELTPTRMLKFRARTLSKGLAYMIRKNAIGPFIRNNRIARANGNAPLDMGLKTMSTRKVNPYQISAADRQELLGDLLPYWKGRTLVDRLEKEMMESGLLSRDMHDFIMAIPGVTSKQVLMLSTCATIATIQGHVILDYGPVLERGLTKMREEVAALEANASGAQRDFLRSVSIALEGVSIFADRMVDKIDRLAQHADCPQRKAELERMSSVCRRVPHHPAETFEEAIQSMWTLKTAVELAHPVNLHCFGRLDQILNPYYVKDLAEGRETAETAQFRLEELLLKIMSQNIRPESGVLGNFYHRFLGSSPVTCGGVRPDGSDGANALTYLFLKAAAASRAVTNLSFRISETTPDDLLIEIARHVSEGASSLSLFNDEVHIDALERRGIQPEDARDYAIMGCVEATLPGKTGCMSASALLLSRLLDITLRNGDSATMAGTIAGDGLATGTADSFDSFDKLLDAVCEQGQRFIAKIVEGANLKDRIYAESLPAPHISAFMEGCLESGKDVTRGGAKYDLSGISMINSAANLIDSLWVIKKLVFEQKRFSLSRIVKALDNDFREDPEILKAIRKTPGKWGNGDPEADRLAHDVMKRLFAPTYEYKNYRGGPFVVYLISMITHTIDGRLSIASPDGRRAATPYAASGNPYNVERSGVTAALRSIAALPYEDACGCAINMKFHPSGVGSTEEARRKWTDLMRSYFQMGGAQLQPMGASAETLKAAQTNPDQFRDLVVKVGGYSAYFTDLGHEIQQEIIARTEHA